MGEPDHYDTTNSGNNVSNNNFFGNNKSFMNGEPNNSFFNQQCDRMDIQNRVGKDITNVLSNQKQNIMQLKKNISSNQDSKGQMNIQKGIVYQRNHSRTTSSILFASKDQKDGKNIQDQMQQQQQQQNTSQFNHQIIGGASSNPFFSKNINVNKSGNFSQNPSIYNQMNRMSDQNYSEKENNFGTQFQQMPQQTIQNQYTNIMANNNNTQTNNHIKTNNFFTSQAVPSAFNQQYPNDASIAPSQTMQNEEESEEIVSGLVSSNGIQGTGVVTTHLAHIEYTREIINHLRQTENKYSSKGGYMGVIQKEINERMRGILLDWLVDVHFKFKLRTETLFISINLIDRYLEKINLQSSRLQLLGITSLFIAAKYEEVYSVPHIKDLVYVCDNAYTKEEIFDMEGSILQVLNFNILSVSSFRFLDYFIQFDELGEKNYYLARYLIEIALLDYQMIGNSPSLLVSATIYLVNKIRKRPIAWKDVMVEITGYQEQDIRPCAKQLCHIVQTIESRKYLNSLRKKFQKTQFLEVAKIKIEQRRDNVSATNNTSGNVQNGISGQMSSMNNISNNNLSSYNHQQQLCDSKEQEIIPEQQQNINNFQNKVQGLNQNFAYNQINYQNQVNFQNQNLTHNQNQFVSHNQNMTASDQQLQQVEYIDISVPLQTSIYLIEKKITAQKIQPNNIVQAILTQRLCSEGAQPIELKVPTQLVTLIIEKSFHNASNKQLLQIPIKMVKMVINQMFDPIKTQDLSLIPVEFVNFMIDNIVNQQMIISQNSQRQ